MKQDADGGGGSPGWCESENEASEIDMHMHCFIRSEATQRWVRGLRQDLHLLLSDEAHGFYHIQHSDI